MLGDLWDPSIASDWVHYASYLMLAQCTKVPNEYERKLYKKGLGNANFRPLNLDGHLTASDASNSRLFDQPALSLRAQLQTLQEASLQGSSHGFGTMTDDVSQVAEGLLRNTRV